MEIILNLKDCKVYGVIYSQDNRGREIIEKDYLQTVKANIQPASSTLQVELYGDRIKNIFTLYTNAYINEEFLIEIEYKFYRIISKKKFTAFPPTHYVCEVEIYEWFI